MRHGYDAISHLYRGDDDDPAEYRPWLRDLRDRLPAGARVLDIGCGNGVPVARTLCGFGFHVTGVDISEVQVARARLLVPGADFVRADAHDLAFDAASFDAVVSFYALIHMPHPEQRAVLERAARWLRPGGRLLCTAGAQSRTGTQDRWLGGDATMWWSHPDAATFRDWLEAAGFEAIEEEFVPEGDGGHQLFRARVTPGR